MIKYTINYVLVLKSLRLWFFTLFLILFSTTVFYIAIEIILKYFLESLKIVKEKLKLIIKTKVKNKIENSTIGKKYDYIDKIEENRIETNVFKVNKINYISKHLILILRLIIN